MHDTTQLSEARVRRFVDARLVSRGTASRVGRAAVARNSSLALDRWGARARRAALRRGTDLDAALHRTGVGGSPGGRERPSLLRTGAHSQEGVTAKGTAGAVREGAVSAKIARTASGFEPSNVHLTVQIDGSGLVGSLVVRAAGRAES